MIGKIVIDTELCKGCGFCVTACPKNCINISTCSNKKGYFPAQPAPSGVEGANNIGCTGCAMCAIICPEVAIEVYRDNNVISVGADKPGKLNLSREKGF